MSNDLNQCNFIGRLGADVEMRYTADGSAIANFRIAVGWKSKDKEGTEWVRIVAFGRLAEVCGEYLHKGKQVFISGGLRTRKWQGSDGQDHYTTEIVAREMKLLAGTQEGQQSGGFRDAKPAKPEQAKGSQFAHLRVVNE